MRGIQSQRNSITSDENPFASKRLQIQSGGGLPTGEDKLVGRTEGIAETSTLEAEGGTLLTSVLTVGTKVGWASWVLSPMLMLCPPESSSLSEGEGSQGSG